MVITRRRALELVAAGAFRSDLYYRLAVIEIRLPAIRSFRAQIPALFAAQVKRECERMQRKPRPVPDEVNTQLLLHDWPGNHRELLSTAQRFALGLEPLQGLPALSMQGALRDKLAAVERHLLSQALQEANGMLRPASKALGLPLETLRYKLRCHRITTGAGRESPD